MSLLGTTVAKFEDVIENLKLLAGTKFITRAEYDENRQKYCSYSHINKTFYLTWNELLEKSGIPIKRKLPTRITQGRKPKDKSMVKTVECLRCLKEFESVDPRINRICIKCKDLCDQEED